MEWVHYYQVHAIHASRYLNTRFLKFQLKKLITDIDKENTNLTALTNALRTAYDEGVKRIQRNKKTMEELKAAIENSILSSSFIDSITKPDDETPTPAPSSTGLISSFWKYTLNFAIIFVYLRPLFMI